MTVEPYPVRYRSPTGIRSLRHMSFTSSEAKCDRIKLQFLARVGYADIDQINSYLAHISGEEGFLPQHIFDLPSDRTRHTRKIQVRRGWLLGGTGKVSNIASASGGTAEIKLTLELNPTRFLAHQADAPLQASEDVYAALATNPSAAHEGLAAALDGNDNILMGFWRNGGTIFEHRQAWWDAVMRDYLARVERLLRFNLEPCDRNGLPPVRFFMEFGALRQAEVYWEGACSDAVSWVLSLADRTRTAAGQMQLRRHFPDARQFVGGQHENGVSLVVELKPSSGDVRLCVYAKSATRVRFEVRYLADVRDTIAARFRGQLNVFDILNLARQDAGNRMTRFNQAIDQLAAAASFDRSDLMELLTAIQWAVNDDQDAARALTSPLMNVGAVSETIDGGIAPRPVLERLTARGVVSRIQVRRGGAHRYALTPTYAALRSALLASLPDHQALAAEREASSVQ